MLDARNCEKCPQNGHHVKRETNKSPLHYTLSRLLYQVRSYNIAWRSVKVYGRHRKTFKQTDTQRRSSKSQNEVLALLDHRCRFILHYTPHNLLQDVLQGSHFYGSRFFPTVPFLASIIWYFITILLENIALSSSNLVSVTTVTNIKFYFNYILI